MPHFRARHFTLSRSHQRPNPGPHSLWNPGLPSRMKVCVSLVNYILGVVCVTPVLFFLPASVQPFELGSLCRVKTDAARRSEGCLRPGAASSRSGNKVAGSSLPLAAAGSPRNWCHQQERLYQGAPSVCFLTQAGPIVQILLQRTASENPKI